RTRERRRTRATATRSRPAGTCAGTWRRRPALLVVRLDGVVGGVLPFREPGEFPDRRVITLQHRPALLVGHAGTTQDRLRILPVLLRQRGIAAKLPHQIEQFRHVISPWEPIIRH